jgi:hypothetical protein
MSQLTLAEIPGFFDLPDSDLAAGQPVTDYMLTKISNNAKFGVVNDERFYMGWFAHGDTVPTPVSAADGYVYSLAECEFNIVAFASRAPAPGFVAGQQALPNQSNTNGGAGELYWFNYDVDDSTGKVSISVAYYVPGGAETDTHDGMVKVRCRAKRLTQTLVPGTGGD